MIEEKALLMFHKFKRMRRSYVRDTMNGQLYQVDRVKMIKKTDDDFRVIIVVSNETNADGLEFDSEYANIYFREVES